jgi:hypothetical protein
VALKNSIAWGKAGVLFISLFFLAVLIAISLSTGYNYYLNFIFSAVYILLVVRLLKKESKPLKFSLITIIALFLLISFLPSPSCGERTQLAESVTMVKDCMCMGIKKVEFGVFGGGTNPAQCLGIQKGEVKCYEFIRYDPLEQFGEKAGMEGYNKEISCP